MLSLAELIATRSATLGLKRGDLARLCGYSNISKGMRRLDELCKGDLASASSAAILAILPSALEVSPNDIKMAVDQTLEAHKLAECATEEARRAKFLPSAYLLGSFGRPTSITLYAITNGAARLRIPLDLLKPPVTFAAQALVYAKLQREIRFFGKTSGFIISYTADRAIRFDLHGNPVETCDRAYEPGDATVRMRSRDVTKILRTVPNGTI